MHMIKPLYGIPESGVHWFMTYHGHRVTELKMISLTCDPCLLITDGTVEGIFAIVGMQTDDTLMLATQQSIDAGEASLERAQFRAKPTTQLTEHSPLEFNGWTLTMGEESIMLKQKAQGRKIEVIDLKAPDRAQRCLEQRASNGRPTTSIMG